MTNAFTKFIEQLHRLLAVFLRDEDSAMSEPAWIKLARSYIGTAEIKGSKHNPKILQMWKDSHLSFKDDETPWCAGFVGAVLEKCGMKSTRSGMARSYEKWGVGLKAPAVGCIVTFKRSGGGHVGFVVGKDESGRLLVLGGNQSDAVNIKAFTTANVTSYRWPSGVATPSASLPVLASAEAATKVT